MLFCRLVTLIAVLVACTSHGLACARPDKSLKTSRHIQIDATSGPIFGNITRYAREAGFLRPKEIVLTFDDGPSPRITRSILRTLAKFCVQATFFPVGRMALAFPDVVQEIAQQGHTIGAHTWSHPYNLRRVGKAKLTSQIEKGFAAIALAAGRPIAPFFRFPGLNDDGRALAHMQKRGIATFSVDVVSDDSYISDVGKLTQTTLARIAAQDGGIVLFHDIKSATTEALPRILVSLRDRGFKVVHLKSKFAFTPRGNYERTFKALLNRRAKPEVALSLDGLHGTIQPTAQRKIDTDPPITFLAPKRKRVELASKRNQRLQNLTKSITLRGWKRLIDEDHAAQQPTAETISR